MKQKRLLIAIAVVLLAAAAGWWRFGRGPEVAAAAAARGTAVEIVYATGGVEPVRWAKVASAVWREPGEGLCTAPHPAFSLCSKADLSPHCGER